MEISHQPCPYVDCGSSNAFSYNDEKMVGKCHSCGQPYPSKLETHGWAAGRYPTNRNKEYDVLSFTPKAVRAESPSSGKWTEMRGINRSTMEQFNVLTFDDRQEYIYPSGGIKVRRLDEKQFYAKNGFKGDELFGMNLFPAGSAKMVTVTEGDLMPCLLPRCSRANTSLLSCLFLPQPHRRNYGRSAMTGWTASPRSSCRLIMMRLAMPSLTVSLRCSPTRSTV